MFFTRQSFYGACLMVVLMASVGCQKKQTVAGFEKKIGTGEHSFVVFDSVALRNKAASSPDWKKTLSDRVPVTAEIEEKSPVEEPSPGTSSSLYLAYPIGLLGHQSIFGGVVTEVSHGKDENLGNLKLSSLPPLHVQTGVGRFEDGGLGLVLQGCVWECDEESSAQGLLAFPIVAVNEKEGLIVLDLGAVTRGLDLMSMLDPTGMITEHKTQSVETTHVEYDTGILVFDIVSHMLPIQKGEGVATEQPTAGESPELLVKTRWYLRLGSVFNPAFKSREQVEGVGFFTTDRSAEPKITRFSLGAPVHYFVKNVPAEFQSSFAEAFEQWNRQLEPVLGRKFVMYQFIASDDPLQEQVVAGDVRFNVVEWDLKNKASYGGFGPSLANQVTGEIFAAQTMVQGPTIVALYTDWFESSQKAHALRKLGKKAEAEKILAQTRARLDRKVKALKQPRFELKLNSRLAFKVQSQNPQLMDSIEKNLHFDDIPEGYDYARYMDGYFKEMVAHELGHNFGLRHNFRGNYGFTSGTEEGSVSHSVMEYLPRDHRHLNRVSRYDVMAIKYGYQGILPVEKNLFCTDENVFDLNDATTSAECSSADAGADSFGYFESVFVRAINLLVARGEPYASAWSLDEPQMVGKLQASLLGLAAYALSPAESIAGWTEFFKVSGRPQSAAAVRNYVLKTVQARLCDSSLDAEALMKETPEAREETAMKIAQLRSVVPAFIAEVSQGSIGVEDLACSSILP